MTLYNDAVFALGSIPNPTTFDPTTQQSFQVMSPVTLDSFGDGRLRNGGQHVHGNQGLATAFDVHRLVQQIEILAAELDSAKARLTAGGL